MSYTEAASVIRNCEKQVGSIKSLAFHGSHKNPKQVFALAHETLKYKPIIDEILKKTKLLSQIKLLKSNQWLGEILLCELLFRKGIRGKYQNVFAGYHSMLQAELARLKIKAKVASNEELLLTFQGDTDRVSCQIPRYVRINRLKVSSVADVLTIFKETYTLVSTEGLTYDRYVSRVKSLQTNEFAQDVNIPEVLVFAPGTSLHKHPLYKEGKIIIQDKASCVPGYVLSTLPLEKEAHCVDCCAAPGNKTSHLAGVLGNSGRIFAFDKDTARVSSMRKLLHTAGVTCVEVTQGDFLKVKVKSRQYSGVSVAVVDPSCSGSGIVSRLSELTDKQDSCSKERLEKLSRFQTKILTHALSFPSLQYAVYSTCSVHEEENEGVVREVLNTWNNVYELVDILPDFPHRGLAKYPDICKKCIRLTPPEDCTNGFFVACFRSKISPAVSTSKGNMIIDSSHRRRASSSNDNGNNDPSEDTEQKEGGRKRKLDSSEKGGDTIVNGSQGEVRKKERKRKQKTGSFRGQITTGKKGVTNIVASVQGVKRKKKGRKGHSQKKPVTAT